MSEKCAPEPDRREIHVAASAVRCPFCHADVEPSARDWVACRSCLARHHSVCWGEGRACATCGGNERLVEQAGSREDELVKLERDWLRAREALFVKVKRGGTRAPTASLVFQRGLLILFGVCWTFATVAITLRVKAPIVEVVGALTVGCAMIALGVWQTAHTKRKLDAYRAAEASYLRRRAHLLGERRGQDSREF